MRTLPEKMAALQHAEKTLDDLYMLLLEDWPPMLAAVVLFKAQAKMPQFTDLVKSELGVPAALIQALVFTSASLAGARRVIEEVGTEDGVLIPAMR